MADPSAPVVQLANAAAPPPQAPLPVVDADGLVHVVTEFGQVQRVAAGDLERAQAQGMRLAGVDEVRGQVAKQDTSGWGGVIGATAAGLGRGLTLGLSDAAIGALGGRETLENLRKYQPGMSLVGELGGAVAGAALTGGESLAARVASAPTRAVMALGEAAGGAATRALGESAIGRLAASGVRAAAEGAGFGAGAGLSEAAITDRYDKLGELVASQAGLGALMGGGTALGLSMLGRGAAALGGAAREKLAGRFAAPSAEAAGAVVEGATGVARPALPRGWRGAVARSAEGLNAGAADDVGAMLAAGPDGHAFRYAAENSDKIFAQHVDPLTASLQSVEDAVSTAGSAFSGGLKKQAVSRALPTSAISDATAAQTLRDGIGSARDLVARMGGDPAAEALAKAYERQYAKAERALADMSVAPGATAEVLAPARAALDEIGSKLEAARAAARGDAALSTDLGRGVKFDALRETIERANERVETGLASGTHEGMVDAFMAVDEAKRKIGDATKSLLKAGKNDLRRLGETQRSTLRELASTYTGQMMPALEHESFGAAGLAQKEINAPWHEVFQSAESAGRRASWSNALTKEVAGEKISGFATTKSAIDQERVGRFMSGLGDPAKSELRQHIASQLDAREAFLQATKKHLAFDPAQAAAVDRGIAAVNDVRRSLGVVDYVAAAKATRQRLAEKAGGSGGASALAGGIIGSGALGVLGPLAAGVGAVYGAVRNPLGLASKLSAIEQLTGRQAAAAARFVPGAQAITGLATVAERSAERHAVAFSAISRRSEAVGTYLVPRTGLAVQSYGRVKADRAEYERRAAMQRRLAMAPETTAATVQHALADIAPHAPQTTAQASIALSNTIAWLNSQLPKLGLQALGPAPAPSKSEQAAFVGKARAVEDPDALVEAIGRGVIPPHAADAVRATAPALFADAQQNAMGALVDQIQNGRVPSYADRKNLALGLDLPVEPMVSPDMIRAMQAAFTPAAQANPATVSQPVDTAMDRSSKAAQTLSDRIGAR